MIAETCKCKENDQDQAFKYYLKGIESEPTFNENFVDLSMLCRDMNELAVSNVVIIFGKAMQQIRQMDKILDMAHAVDGDEQSMFTLDELIFEEVLDEERSMIRLEPDPGNYNQLAEEAEALPEIRLKEDLHSLLIAAVCELKERI